MKNKKDTSVRVPQREKINGSLQLRPFPWTPRQQEFLDLALAKDTRIIFFQGPAGTTKTILSVYAALELLSNHRLSDLLYIRSAVESADSKIGYLPGEVDDKMAYYGIPLLDKLDELLPKQQVEYLKKDKRISVQPVNFVRGQSWNAKVVIVDEAQNMTRKEIFTVLTRIGKFSKCYVLADPQQSDINGKSGGFVSLAEAYERHDGPSRGIHYVKFTKKDCLRDPLTAYLVDVYEELTNQEAAAKK